MRRIFLFLGVLGVLGGCGSSSSSPRAMLMISLDGMKPEYVTRADELGMKVPHLRALLREGTYSGHVRGVLPTSTFPAHTTMVTGAAPARHGIVSNKPFDVKANPESWYWFSEAIRVPTLWDVAAARGMDVASVNWPVTVGTRAIRYNIAEYNDTRTPTDLSVIRAVAGPNLMDELAATAGPYGMDVETGNDRDWSRTKYAIELIRQKKPGLVLVHISAADHFQHQQGPFTAEVKESVEKYDAAVGAMREAMLGVYPNAAVCVVSDHGFSAVIKLFRLDAALVREGLITPKGKGATLHEAGIKDYVVTTWSSGGSTALVLKNRNDAASAAKVKALLDKLAADPANGIAKVYDRSGIDALGAAPGADFWVDFKPGTQMGTALEGPLVADVKPQGTHGYAPTHAEMESFFVIAGKGIAQGNDLGAIDMRAIGPTVAKEMGLNLPAAEMQPLPIRRIVRGDTERSGS